MRISMKEIKIVMLNSVFEFSSSSDRTYKVLSCLPRLLSGTHVNPRSFHIQA